MREGNQQNQNNQQNQQRRQLPRRASRGVRSQQTEQQKQQDDQIYNNLFGDMNQSEQSDQSFENQLGLRPLQAFTANFANYNYGRGYHYFFNLDTFPRVQGSPSYALDDKNRFKHTFSHDEQIINGTQMKKLLNRTYVGLPTTQTTFSNKKSKDKNVCHYHLFNIQDKKYHNHRLLSKYKYVLKNIQKLHKQDKLKYYTQLRKDVVTHQVCQADIPISRRTQILQQRIKVLSQRIKNMSPHWNWQDNIYYYFSLDQKFHDLAMYKGQKLSQKYLNDYIMKRLAIRKQYIEGIQYGQLCLGIDKLKNAVQNWLKFQEQENNALTIVMQNRLKSMPKIIQMFRRKEQLIIFPLFIFNFGSRDIERFIDSLIKDKLQKDYQSCFYVYKAFMRRLLKRQLACQQQKVSQPMLGQQYTNLMKQKLQKIEQFYQKQQIQYKKVLYADQIVQFQQIQNSPVDQQILLLEPGHKIQVSLKQLMLLFFYRNISIALEQFAEYLKYDPEILKFMVNDKYDKYHYGIAKVIHQPEFCILINDLNRFAQILSSPSLQSEHEGKFFFSFNQKLRIAYAWRENEGQDWETQKDHDQEDLNIDIVDQQNNQDDVDSMKNVFEDGDPKPSKKQKI